MDKPLTISISGAQGSGKTLLTEYIIRSLTSLGMTPDDTVERVSRLLNTDHDVTKLVVDNEKLARVINDIIIDRDQDATCHKVVTLDEEIYQSDGFVKRLLHSMIGLLAPDEPEWSDRIILEVRSTGA